MTMSNDKTEALLRRMDAFLAGESCEATAIIKDARAALVAAPQPEIEPQPTEREIAEALGAKSTTWAALLKQAQEVGRRFGAYAAPQAPQGVRYFEPITSCADCPACLYGSAGYYECEKMGRRSFERVGKPRPMPSWCPLPVLPSPQAPAEQPATPEKVIDYKALIAYCYKTLGHQQGTKGCIAFARGAEWALRTYAALPSPKAPAEQLAPLLFVAMDDDKRAHLTWCVDEAAVREAVKGAMFFLPDGEELDHDHTEQLNGSVEELLDSGALTFEGDPPLYLYRVATKEQA